GRRTAVGRVANEQSVVPDLLGRQYAPWAAGSESSIRSGKYPRFTNTRFGSADLIGHNKSDRQCDLRFNVLPPGITNTDHCRVSPSAGRAQLRNLVRYRT